MSCSQDKKIHVDSVFFNDQSLSNSCQSTRNLLKRIFIQEIEHILANGCSYYLLEHCELVGPQKMELFQFSLMAVYYIVLPSGITSGVAQCQNLIFSGFCYMIQRFLCGQINTQITLFFHMVSTQSFVTKFGTNLTVANLSFSGLYSKLYSTIY